MTARPEEGPPEATASWLLLNAMLQHAIRQGAMPCEDATWIVGEALFAVAERGASGPGAVPRAREVTDLLMGALREIKGMHPCVEPPRAARAIATPKPAHHAPAQRAHAGP